MEATTEGIVAAALRLSEAERVHILQELLDSLSPDAEKLVDDAWAAELDRRLMEFEQDGADAVSWSQLKEQK